VETGIGVTINPIFLASTLHFSIVNFSITLKVLLSKSVGKLEDVIRVREQHS